MWLSDVLAGTAVPYTLIRDGAFQILEQCTRIRGEAALTYLEREKFLSTMEDPRITCVICTPELAKAVPAHIAGVVSTEEAKLLFFRLNDRIAATGEKRPTVIDPSARVSPLACIASYNVMVGPRTEIQPYVVVEENTEIGADVRICAGSVIGAQSFTAVHHGGQVFLAKDAGKTVIEDGVEICAQCDIARGTLQLDTTRIGAYTKLDAKVHIGHGSVLGKRVQVPSGAHIAGNCVVGDDVWIGVNATVSNRIEIGDHARVSLGSVVTKNVPAGQTVTGNFAIDHAQFMKNLKASVEETSRKDSCPPPADTGG